MEGEEKGEKEKEKKKIPKNRKKKDERRAQAALRRNLNDQCDPSASYNRTTKIESADPPKEPPKESKVKDKDEDTIDFPSVTVCNRNIVHCKRLKRFLSDVCDGPNGNNKCQNRQALLSLQTLGKCEEDPLNLDQFKDLEKEESKIDDSDEMFQI